MIVYGASGHSKVIIDIVQSNEQQTVNFIIDDNPQIKELLGFKVLHSFPMDVDNESIVFAVGNNQTRRFLAKKYPLSATKALVHATAVVSQYSEIQGGTVV
ncbi:acetyltransferase, partial [Gramella sp. BOM4]|nr:acetyltransferase [Christiangramia bathymodioli]